MKVKIKYPRKCRHKGCRRSVQKSEHSPDCYRHRFLTWREKNPLRYSFGNLRRRAKERGITFSLTFDEYKAFAEKTDYAKLKGKSSLSLSIDRKENSLGYHAWNIKAITIRENSRKQWVPYFNNGMSPDDRREYIRLETDNRTNLETIAEIVSMWFKPGTAMFWKEFQSRKEKLIAGDLTAVAADLVK